MDIPVINNLYGNIPAILDEEYFEVLLEDEKFFLERIVSEGQSTPEGTWLCENSEEWVILLQGSAKLIFQPGNPAVTMIPGDYCIIPSEMKHRVEWTDPDIKTVWLALHWSKGRKE